MTNFLIVMSVFLSLTAGATEKKSAGKEVKMPDFSGLNSPEKSSSNIKVEHNCTGQDGRTLKAGEAGYDTCTSAASSRAQSGLKTGQETTTGVSVKVGK